MKRKIRIITKFMIISFIFMGNYFINTEKSWASESNYLNKIMTVNLDSGDVECRSGDSIEVSRGNYDKGVEVANYAYKFLGKPYVYGATGPNSFDCSGLTQYVYNKFGAGLTRTTYTQVKQGVKVERKNLKCGDLVFFNTHGSLSHVGIYIGGGKFIHAPRSGKPVMISSLAEGYYHDRYETARRIF